MRNKSFEERAKQFPFSLGRRLLELMSNKESNLAFSADIRRKKLLLDLVDQIGPHICVLKTHLDILDDFDPSVIKTLTELSQKHHFFILEDRKFADIGSVVQSQYCGGSLHIADWAHLVTVHGIAGSGTVEGLKESVKPEQRASLMLAEMSSSGNLIDENYTKSILQIAKKEREFVLGFISQHRLCEEPDFLYFTPGIGIKEGSDSLGQNHRDPRDAVLTRGTDVVIVGRQIYNAKDPVESSKRHKELAWKAYLERSTQGF